MQTVLFQFLALNWCSVATTQQNGAEWNVVEWIKNEKSTLQEFDVEMSSEFIKESGNFGVFSPLAFEMNLYMQFLNKENFTNLTMDTYMEEKIKTRFEKLAVTYPVKQSDAFYCANAFCSGSPNILNSNLFESFFIRKNFDEECKKQYDEWIDKKTNNRVQSALELPDFSVKSRIYTSAVYFCKLWAYTFNISSQCSNNTFKTLSGNTVIREFLEIEEKFFYIGPQKGDEIKFHVVYVPFARTSSSESFYMIYIVPIETVNLNVLWESVKSKCDSNIGNLFSKSENASINLKVPTINSKSPLIDCLEIFKTTYGNHAESISSSKISSYLRVNEKGVEAVSLMETTYEGCEGSSETESEVISVTANIPYIGIIFDKKQKRICFITKDTGIFDN